MLSNGSCFFESLLYGRCGELFELNFGDVRSSFDEAMVFVIEGTMCQLMTLWWLK